jgi:hypothetical protein
MASALQGTRYRSRGDGNIKDDVRFLRLYPASGVRSRGPFPNRNYHNFDTSNSQDAMSVKRILVIAGSDSSGGAYAGPA